MPMSTYSIMSEIKRNISLGVILYTLFITNVLSSGVVRLNVIEVGNKNNVDVSGNCCNPNENVVCSQPCNTFMRICATHVSSFQSYFNLNLRIDPNMPCSFGLWITNVFDRDVPYEQLKRNFTYHFPRPGKILLIFEAWNSPNGSEPVDGAVKDGVLLARYVNQHILSPSDKWITANLTGHNEAYLSYSLQVMCATDYTGFRCTEKCPAPNDTKATFVCSTNGNKICREGWTGGHCDQPICSEGCHPTQGYCNKPNECLCRIGWRGETCEECITMLGCLHGTCNRTLECNCVSGWDGFFCSQPVCKDSCHPTRGYCEEPNECKCKVGWKGKVCDECRRLPGCVHGYCEKPFDCLCEEGWAGLFCHIPKCKANCNESHGYCNRPNECRCRIGWQGENCDQCFPYPGCQNGTCTKPWECNCLSGWNGPTCDQKTTYCDLATPCLNNGSCIDKTDQDGDYICLCPENYTGTNCEVELNS